jgi:uncharacterized delta-60 repeat protein
MRKSILFMVLMYITIILITGGIGACSKYIPAKGELDKSFGKVGIVVHHNAAGGNSDDVGKSIYVDNNGRIYVTGYSYNGRDGDMVLCRYNSDGSLDKTFGNKGIVVAHNAAGGNSEDVGKSIYVDNKGRIYVTGFSVNSNRDGDMVIWRYNTDGSLDKTFGNKGIVVAHNAAGGNRNDVGESIYVDSNGKIYVTGYSRNSNRDGDMVLCRYNSDGSLDKTFGNKGIVVAHNAAGGNSLDGGNSVYVDSNGKIYVTGFSVNSNRDGDMVIWRYNTDGSLDKTFGNKGIVVAHNAAGGNDWDEGNSIYVDSNGKIYVTGFSLNRSRNYDMVIWRYNSDGSIDKTFGDAGVIVDHDATGGKGNDVGNSIYVDSNGRIYVTGFSINRNGNRDMVIWRYNSNGTLDNSFGNGGIVVHHNAAGGKGNDVGNSIYVDSNGKVYVTGYSVSRNGDKDMVIWKYK